MWLFLLVLALAVLPAMGQVDRATINGTVTDGTGAVLPGVEIVAIHQETSIQHTGLTTDIGQYSILNLPIGTYTISFSLPGFSVYERTDFTVTTGQTARLNVTLEVGAITDTITISASSEIMDTDTPLVSTTMQSDILSDLPFSFDGGRYIESFAYAVTPAVEGDNWESFLIGGAAFSKEVLIDGISATAQIQGHVGESSPTMEAVEEFKVQTSGMSAEYGHTSGGVFQFTLKSGTNDFHGSAFYYFRNKSLNANTWMNNWRLAQDPGNSNYERADDSQNLLGFSAGGPIIIPKLYDGRDKSFIFGAFEHYTREDFQLGAMNATTPIPAFLDGDFSALLTGETIGTDALGRDVEGGQIFDPLTLQQVEGSWVSDPFPGNIIPQDRFSATSQQIIPILRDQYAPMSNRLTNNMARTATNSPWFHQTQLTIKGDHSFSDSNRLSGSLIWTQRPRMLVDQGGLWNPNDADGGGGPLSRARKQIVKSRRATLSDNWTLKPNLINTLQVAFNRYINPSTATADLEGGNWSQDLGLDNTNMGNFPQTSFGAAVNGVWTTQIGYNSGGKYVANTYIVTDSVDWITGRHGIKFGGEFWYQQLNDPKYNDMTSYSFENWTTGHPKTPYQDQVGFGFASFLLGDVDSASKNVAANQYGRRSYLAFYVNDDFKVTPKLTLNLGLRWDQSGPLWEKNGMWANFTSDVLNTNPNGYWPIEPGVPGALDFATGPETNFEGDRAWNLFAPRVGFAYRITDKAVLRGGYGLFYSPMGIQSWSGIPYGTYASPDMFGTDRVPTAGKTTPTFNWDDGYQGNFQEANRDPNFLTWGMIAFDENTLKLAYTHQYNINLQYEFTPDTMVEFTFLGNDGRRLHAGFLRRNQAERATWEAIPDPGAWVSDEGSAGAAGVPYPFPGFSGYAGMAVLPFPQVAHCGWGWCPWSPLYYVASPLGESSYRSFQVNLTRRMASGIAANISYNYSTAKGNAQTAFDENWNATGSCSYQSSCTGIQDVYNLDESAGTVAPFDQTHVFKGLASFELPFGQGRKWLSNSSTWVDAILGGWQLTGIFRYNTGNPMGINPQVWQPGWTDPPNGAVYANIVDNPNWTTNDPGNAFDPGNPSSPANTYFVKENFSRPGYGELGNGNRLYSDLRGFGWANEDIGLMKFWALTESARLQFRAEFLNILNRHHLQNPGIAMGNSATFGQVIDTTGGPRNIQLGLRLNW